MKPSLPQPGKAGDLAHSVGDNFENELNGSGNQVIANHNYLHMPTPATTTAGNTVGFGGMTVFGGASAMNEGSASVNGASTANNMANTPALVPAAFQEDVVMEPVTPSNA
mmetsp:Transcript_12776/g.31046  ORF Transcript_12776/g.31046 Transcript_12776/m.31046 type:complete len:110 (+) Transcript_12776:272-601(+)|eukprot:g6211.t1